MSFTDAKIRVNADETSQAQYAMMQWVHGDQKMKKVGGVPYTGGFFIGCDRCPDDFVIPPGFKPDEITFENGKAVVGYLGLSVEIALIRTRRRWVLKNGMTQYLPWNQYTEGAKSQVQVLVGVKGCNVPLAMSFNGKSKGESLKALYAAADALLSKANEGKEKGEMKYPRLTFYIPAISAASLDPAKGFQQVTGAHGQSSPVTPLVIHPAIGDLSKITVEMLDKRYVGDEQMDRYQKWCEEAETWAHAWDKAQVVSNDESAQTPEEDVPF